MRDERKAEILISSKHIHQRIENIISARLAHNDITAAQSHVLMFVMSCDAPVYASDIQKKMNIFKDLSEKSHILMHFLRGALVCFLIRTTC